MALCSVSGPQVSCSSCGEVLMLSTGDRGNDCCRGGSCKDDKELGMWLAFDCVGFATSPTFPGLVLELFFVILLLPVST